MQVAVRELKNHLSDYLKKAEAGEEIFVTTHGKPIARISQLEPEVLKVDVALQGLNWIRPAKKKARLGLPTGEQIRATAGKALGEMLLDDRE